MRWEAEGSRNMRRMSPISVVFFGRSISVDKEKYWLEPVKYHKFERTVNVGRTVKIDPQNTTGR